MEYHTSDDEEEEQSPRVTAAETRRGDDDDGEEENLLTCINCGALGDILEEGGDKFQFRLNINNILRTSNAGQCIDHL